jgi:hypothetical protein
MSNRANSWLACSLASLSVAMFVANVVLYFLIPLSVQPPTSWGTGGLSIVLIFLLPFLAFPMVGALIASRRPKNPIGWICLAVGIFWMLANLSSGYGIYGLLTRPGSVPFPAAIGSVGEWMWVPAVGLLSTYLILLFPDGKLPSRRWLPLAWLSGAVIFLASAGFALSPGPMDGLPGTRNPFGLEEYPWVADATLGVILLLPLCILASATSLVLRFLRSGGEEREQIKWLAFAASLLGLGFSTYAIPGTIWQGDAGGANPLWAKLLEDAVTLSFAGIPVAVGIAILRYRLYEIDTLINRTLVYGALTATLVAVYVVTIVVLQGLIRALTGQESQIVIVASTLAVAALFNPLRHRIQGFIDRRFYRRKYDAAKTLEAFSAKLRNETDLDALSDDLTSVIRETMQPAHVSLWMRPDTAAKKEDATG